MKRLKVSIPAVILAFLGLALLVLLVLVVLGVRSFMSGGFAFGPGLADFSAPLSGGYMVCRMSAHQIIVVPEAGWNDATPIIPPKVVELGHDDTFIVAKQQHLRRRDAGPYKEPDPGAFSYWILNVKIPQVWGPLSKNEFMQKRSELAVPAGLKLRDVDSYRP